MVRRAVIPAAGLGTRLLPATKAQPKEMIPVVDKPAVQYAVEEAVAAGIQDIVIVVGRGRQTLEDHFDRAVELEAHLQAAGKNDVLDEVRRISELADIHFVRQGEPLGFGHAVLCGRAHVGDDSFAVLVPDEIVPPPSQGATLLLELVRAHSVIGADVVAVQAIEGDAISSYGVIEPNGEPAGRLVRVASMVEKPSAENAPSDLAARGRYVFGPEIFEVLDKTSRDPGGEIQLTSAIDRRARDDDVRAYIYEGPILDTGKKLDLITTTIELALSRDDLAPGLRAWLEDRLGRD